MGTLRKLSKFIAASVLSVGSLFLGGVGLEEAGATIANCPSNSVPGDNDGFFNTYNGAGQHTVIQCTIDVNNIVLNLWGPGGNTAYPCTHAINAGKCAQGVNYGFYADNCDDVRFNEGWFVHSTNYEPFNISYRNNTPGSGPCTWNGVAYPTGSWSPLNISGPVYHQWRTSSCVAIAGYPGLAGWFHYDINGSNNTSPLTAVPNYINGYQTGTSGCGHDRPRAVVQVRGYF